MNRLIISQFRPSYLDCSCKFQQERDTRNSDLDSWLWVMEWSEFLEKADTTNDCIAIILTTGVPIQDTFSNHC